MENNTIPKIIVFDFDLVLVENTEPIDPELSGLFVELLAKTKIALVSGSKFEGFVAQAVEPIKAGDDLLQNLYLFPNSGGAFFRFVKGKFGAKWEPVYERLLPKADKDKIMAALSAALKEAAFRQPNKIYGQQVEERGCQLTFLALGSEAPKEDRAAWDTDGEMRARIVAALKTQLPDFNVFSSGLTSIDIMPAEINRSYAVSHIEKILSIPLSEMLYVAGAQNSAGGDRSVLATGVQTNEIHDIADIKLFIRQILNQSS